MSSKLAQKFHSTPRLQENELTPEVAKTMVELLPFISKDLLREVSIMALAETVRDRIGEVELSVIDKHTLEDLNKRALGNAIFRVIHSHPILQQQIKQTAEYKQKNSQTKSKLFTRCRCAGNMQHIDCHG